MLTSRGTANAKDHGTPFASRDPDLMPLSDSEQEKESYEQREDAQSFRNGEAEYQTAELAVGSRGVAQCAGEVITEDTAECEGRTSHAEACETCADVLCCFRFHVRLLEI
ncbi:hypothetical protein AGR8A_Cc60125 [Agrobacterium fabrum str. J-07]|nr:hypothetical protein AGR8A_Cc60125 [Agrobacterium fabrum str. J-07]